MKRITKILAVFFIVLALSSNSLWAKIITINITAQITSIDDLDGVLNGQLSVGDIIRGTYTYDSCTPDSRPLNPAIGDYQHHSPPYGIRLSAGGFTFQTDPNNVEFLVEICNDYGYSGRDNYLIISYNNLPLYDNVHIGHISWQLDDSTGTALSTDALPTTPPVLEDWDFGLGIRIEGGIPDEWGKLIKVFYIRAPVISVTLAPDIQAEIDINPNTLNLQSKGKWLTCHIWLPEDYNVTDVNSYSIFLKFPEDEIYSDWLWFNENQNVVSAKFSRSQLQELLSDSEEVLETGQAELTITGQLLDGTTFEGTDVIRVINKGKKE